MKTLILVFHVILLLFIPSPTTAVISAPQYAATPDQRARAVSAVEADIRSAEPLYQFHPAGKKTYGTVIFWHGGTGQPSELSLLARYLYENNFNVYLPPLPGHSFTANRWPYALFRDEKGGRTIREVLRTDPQIKNLAAAVNNGSVTPILLSFPPGIDSDMQIKRIMSLLREKLSEKEFGNFMKVLQLVTKEGYSPGLEGELFDVLETDHYRFESMASEQMAKVIALPGPVYAGGSSMGGLSSLFASARTKIVERAVLLAPFFGAASPPDFKEFEFLIKVAGLIDPLNMLGGATLPSRVFPAWDVAGRIASQPEIHNNVKKNTATFCVMGEGDRIGDFDIGAKICNSSLRNSDSVFYAYPENTNVGHNILPGRNQFTTALVKEILRYYVNGETQTKWLLTENGDPDLPAVKLENVTFPVENM